METQIVQLHNMESLDRLLKAEFPAIGKVKAYHELARFDIYIDKDCDPVAPLVKALDKYLGPFVAEYGEVELPYYFEIHRENELLDILRYNDPESEFYIAIEIDGKVQMLRILDLMGGTRDYTVFNSDFEKLGHFFSEGPANFVEADYWQTNDEQLKPYLEEIISKIGEQLNGNAGQDEVNVDDPLDLAFWAEQFDISITELKKAVLAAGKSVDSVTAYLQK